MHLFSKLEILGVERDCRVEVGDEVPDHNSLAGDVACCPGRLFPGRLFQGCCSTPL